MSFRNREPSRTEEQEKKTVRRRRWRPPYGLLLLLFFAVSIWFLYQNENADDGPVYPEVFESESLVGSSSFSVPDYYGEAVIDLNNGIPCFTENERNTITGEFYSPLDRLGRCGPAAARLGRDMMPEGEREEIGDIRPTGWVQKKYPGIVDSDPPYLYNRCHLIAHAMTGQNANPRNLITGTRYMNAVTMLDYEVKVLRYLDRSENHVLYRVSPYFRDSERVARGVEMEAYSIEDHGAGVCFHVFVYNIQPGIEIDYATGDSWESNP